MTTTTSASAAAWRARSAKQTPPCGHRLTPGHSREETLTADQAAAVPLPTIKAGVGSNDGYFLMALPKEAELSKQIVRVAGGGAAGALNQTLASQAGMKLQHGRAAARLTAGPKQGAKHTALRLRGHGR